MCILYHFIDVDLIFWLNFIYTSYIAILFRPKWLELHMTS